MKKKKINMEKEEIREIVRRWRLLGLLDGIRINSEIEERVAISFQKMAEKIVERKCDSPLFTVLIFPSIRRSLVPGDSGGYLKRVIEPEEIITTLEQTTFDDANEMVKKIYPVKSYHRREMLYNVIKYKGVSGMNIMDFLREKTEKDVMDENERSFFCAIAGINDIDIEAEICAIISRVIVLKLKK